MPGADQQSTTHTKRRHRWRKELEMQPAWRRVAAYVLCRDSDDRILLTRFVQDGNPESGSWTMPGGGMEWGEQPDDTAIRELHEETGLQASLGPVLGVFSRWLKPDEAVTGEPGHYVGIIYGTTEIQGELRTEFSDDTTDAAAWFSLEEVQSITRVSLVDYVLTLLT